MKEQKIYEADDKMISLIGDNYNLLQALGSFGISLGFGDKTVRETCQSNGVDTHTFLTVVNYAINGIGVAEDDERISVSTLLHYLEASHAYFLDFQLPYIRRELEESLDEKGSPLAKLIMKLYDEYAHEIMRHMNYEQQTLFPYVKSLLDGKPASDYNVETYSKHHDAADQQLHELKILIIKYLPHDEMHNNQLTAALHDIYENEVWLHQHAMVEDHIFVPAIRRLEHMVKHGDVNRKISNMVFKDGTHNTETLSDREKDVIIALVQGMANKEIAEHLGISTNTVITHRRNIARKLQIHSPAGLTIYAIVNNLININSVKM